MGIGSYFYGMPGHAEDRALLARPVDDRIFFAVEACPLNFFSTVYGAYETGTTEAKTCCEREVETRTRCRMRSARIPAPEQDRGRRSSRPHARREHRIFPATAVKRDAEIMMIRSVKAGIPFIIGSAGTYAGLAWMVDIVREIARAQGLHFKPAVIHSRTSDDLWRSVRT